MVKITVVVLSLICIAITFSSPLLAWIVFAFPVLLLLISLASLKGKRWNHVPELSHEANKLLNKFGHFYHAPFAGSSYSGAASTLMFAGAIVGLIGLSHRYWWGLAIALGNYVVMGFVSRAFNPSKFLVDDTERSAHEEIIIFIRQKEELASDSGSL